MSDLVSRLTLQEAGPLLTARQSPAVPRLGLPAFYWGTNAIHGVVGSDVCVLRTDNKTQASGARVLFFLSGLGCLQITEALFKPTRGWMDVHLR